MKKLLIWFAITDCYAYLLYMFFICVVNEPLLTHYLQDKTALADFISIYIVAAATALYVNYTYFYLWKQKDYK